MQWGYPLLNEVSIMFTLYFAGMKIESQVLDMISSVGLTILFITFRVVVGKKLKQGKNWAKLSVIGLSGLTIIFSSFYFLILMKQNYYVYAITLLINLGIIGYLVFSRYRTN
jgi:multisubunit Na+/H+ antiporter MnhF subunit